jgi:uncharacterized protein YdeI (YjbR/CyaY-like superfamily)
LKPVFFATPADFRAWLEEHHTDERELIVGFYRKASGKQSITWSEAVGQALCFGWIDGVRRGIDDERYTVRFTPRRPRSIWSAVNVARVAELTKCGLMHPAGIAAFEARTDERTGIYSHEQREAAKLTRPQERQFRANRRAWRYFQAQPAGYRHQATWWVVSAKQEETRERRLQRLIADSEQERAVGPLRRPGPNGG